METILSVSLSCSIGNEQLVMAIAVDGHLKEQSFLFVEMVDAFSLHQIPYKYITKTHREEITYTLNELQWIIN